MLFSPSAFLCRKSTEKITRMERKQVRVWRSNTLEMQSGKNQNNKESLKGIKPLSCVCAKYFNYAFLFSLFQVNISRLFFFYNWHLYLNKGLSYNQYAFNPHLWNSSNWTDIGSGTALLTPRVWSLASSVQSIHLENTCLYSVLHCAFFSPPLLFNSIEATYVTEGEPKIALSGTQTLKKSKW